MKQVCCIGAVARLGAIVIARGGISCATMEDVPVVISGGVAYSRNSDHDWARGWSAGLGGDFGGEWAISYIGANYQQVESDGRWSSVSLEMVNFIGGLIIEIGWTIDLRDGDFYRTSPTIGAGWFPVFAFQDWSSSVRPYLVAVYAPFSSSLDLELRVDLRF